MRRALLLLLLLGACRFGFDELFGGGGGSDAQGSGDGAMPPPFEPYWRVGTRLRAVLLTPVAGGDPLFMGFRDTVMTTTCRNVTAADGNERCLPSEVSGNIYYADAACTVPLGLAYLAHCLTGNTYAINFDTMGRGHAFPLTTLHAGTIYDSRAGCVPTTPGSFEYVYDLGAEEPPTSFLLGAYHNEMIGSYKRPFQGTEDGSSIEIGSLDLGGVSCWPVANGLGPASCRSTLFRGEPVYSDSACTQRAYFWDRNSYDPASTTRLQVVDPQACETQYHLYAVTADVTAPTFYRLTTAGCQASSTPATGRLYTATEIAETAPLGTIVEGPRRGRLGYLYWVAPDGSTMAERYYDLDLHVPCLPFVASDGRLRCLPRDATPVTASPDASCSGATRPLVTSCFGGAPLHGTTYASCLNVTTTVKALPQVGSSASTYNETTCTPLDTPGGVYDPSTPGAVLDPTMFAELMEVIQ